MTPIILSLPDRAPFIEEPLIAKWFHKYIDMFLLFFAITFILRILKI